MKGYNLNKEIILSRNLWDDEKKELGFFGTSFPQFKKNIF